MSRHTEPMTDAYIAAQRLRNEARAKAAAADLGDVWLLHPANHISRDEYLASRRATAFRQGRALILSTPGSDEEFERLFNRREPLAIQHEGGAQ